MNSAPNLDISGIHVLDGGFATELERRGYDISGPLWSARVLDDAPEVIHQVHLDYLRAGADCISTASYQVSALGYAELGRPSDKADRALRRSVELAEAAREQYRREADRFALIALSLGPYGAALHNGAEFHGRYEIEFDELVTFHAERLAGAAEAGADLIALETIPSIEEARAILIALGRFPLLRAWLSFTCRDQDHVAHGERLADCAALVEAAPQVVALGINCTHPMFVAGLIDAGRSSNRKPVFVYPNSGEVWDAANRSWMGKSDPFDYGALAAHWFAVGAQAVGGCCRTTPAHVRAVREAWRKHGGQSAPQTCDNRDSNAMKSASTVAPPPVAVTPELLAQHGITAEEYERILAALGRTPSLTELGIYSVMWSEHCSYKSSRVHLKRLPTKSERVVQGPGENAGIIDVGDGWACAFKIESHNHPSYIEPYQGAATGVGGILRDIFTMNARPLAVMDSLRFGPIAPDGQTPAEVIRKNHSILEGVVSGIAGYGNCFGVPNLGGETKFEPCYSGNPLVNAFALGLVRRDEIFYAKATGVGNPVIYVGAKTGRDGIHGATMASEEFKEGSEQKRPNVQVGDPFMEKLLLEACLEAMQTGAVLGIQDMGAAGLTCSTCEMGARGGVGLEVELDNVPQRETGMSAYEIMLSESQERMLLVAEKGREGEVLRVFDKWGLDASIVGTVIGEPRMRILQHGEVVADIPNQSLTDDAPVYHRPVGTWKAPVPLDPPAKVLEELKKPRDYTADLKKLLASSNICSKRWVYEQYDSMVQTNTVQGPGGEAGVMRIKGTNRGLAMALAGNSRWCYLDPKLGAMHAVAEAARKVSCTGATPVAATNCLNFGNPEKPEIMAQLSAAIDGITEACTALGTPITGGNVSLYNETKGEGIYPTPVLGIVGIIDDVTKAVPSDFQNTDDTVLLLWPDIQEDSGTESEIEAEQHARQMLGSGELARTVFKRIWGGPPFLDLRNEAALLKLMTSLADKRLIYSATDIADGGIAVALAKAGFAKGFSCEVNIENLLGRSPVFDLFWEFASQVIVSCKAENVAKIEAVAGEFGYLVDELGKTTSSKFTIRINDTLHISTSIADLKQSWSSSLESNLHDQTAAEVLA